MEDQAVSAFAAYAARKIKKKELGGFKIKPKHKLKKKKSKDTSINTLMVKLIKEARESTTSKDKKKKKKLGKEMEQVELKQKAPEQSFFENCSLTSKLDNVFLRENGISDDAEVNEKHKTHSDSKIKPKKLKKRKITDGEESENVKKRIILNQSPTNGISDQNAESVTITSSGRNNNDTGVLHRKKLKQVVGKFKSPDLIYSDSNKIGEELFSWLLSPVGIDDFFTNCWEQKPLHVKHSNENYFKCICTMDDFKTALSEHDMYFTRNIDVTSYINGVRNTENPEGKAKPAAVWDFYRSGRSIRLLNPQTFIPNIRMLNSFLQEFFQCFVGANIYLTPPGTQGFAPHYDDIEAFVLQLEGEKHWKLYNPRTPDEVLPRESSRNFSEDEIGDPIFEVTLQAGDLLYFPRGIIHQAKCLPHVHSLHITVSCYQKNSWADLLEKVLPVALQRAISENVEFRKGLPIGYLNHLGMVYSDQKSDQRLELIRKFEEIAQKVLEYCPLDAGVDQLGAGFLHDALPPYLTRVEKLYGGGRDNENINQCLLDGLKNYSKKRLGVKLIRANSVRLVTEQDELILYYSTDNSLVYHEQESASVSVPSRWAQAVDQLIHSYPKFLGMKDLAVSDKIGRPGLMKDRASMIQLPPAAGMDRLPLPMSFNASDLLLRYPLGFPTPSNQGYLSDFKLHLPSSLATDPRLWSREDVVYFLRWCETEFDLPHFDMDLFQMNGKALCFLTKSDLNERCSWSGRVLHNVLQLLLRETNSVQRCLPSSPGTPQSRHPSYPFGPIPYGSWSLSDLYAQNAAHIMNSNPVTLSPAPSTDSQSRSPEHSSTDNQASSGFESGGSTGSHQSDSEEENFVDTSPPAAPPPNSTSPNANQKHGALPQRQQQTQHFFPPGPNDVSHEPNTNGRLLWDFLQQLLNDPAQRYTNFIAWKNHETGVFKIVDPAGLAKLWGIQKNHLSMNYDKMSRALRYYYRVNILRKVQGERHCYQFLRNPSELKSIKNISLLRQQITMQQQQQQQQSSQNLLPPPPPPTPMSTYPSITITPIKKEPIQEDAGVDGMSDGDGPTDLSTRFTQSPGPTKQEGDKPTDLSVGEHTMHLSIVKSE